MEFLDVGAGIAKCMPREKTLIKSVFIMSIIFLIEAFISLFILDTPEIYNMMSYKQCIISKLIITISSLPGRIVLVINGHVFLFSFLQQLQKLQYL